MTARQELFPGFASACQQSAENWKGTDKQTAAVNAPGVMRTSPFGLSASRTTALLPRKVAPTVLARGDAQPSEKVHERLGYLHDFIGPAVDNKHRQWSRGTK